MPPPWVTPGDIIARIADDLDKPQSQITSNWATKIRDGIEFATNEIVMRLAVMGYSTDQMDTWDRRVEFSKSLALWWAYTKGHVPTNSSKGEIAELDRREELKKDNADFFFTSGGALQFPAAAGNDESMASFASHGRVLPTCRTERNIQRFFNDPPGRDDGYYGSWPWGS